MAKKLSKGQRHKNILLPALGPILKLNLWKEYETEAEHEEGVGYWLQFSNVDEVINDFNIFCDALAGD